MAAAPLVLANSSGTVLGTQASIFPGNTHNALVGNTVAVMVSSPSGVSSVTDNASGGSNTYTKVLELQAPSSGNFVSVFTCLVARSLAVDSTERIFLNFPSSTASASWRIIGMGGDWHVSDATGTNSGTGTAVTVTTTGNRATKNDVVLGAFAFGNTTFTGSNLTGTVTGGEPTQQAASLGWVQDTAAGASGATSTVAGTLGASGAWAGAVVTLSPPAGIIFVKNGGTAGSKAGGITFIDTTVPAGGHAAGNLVIVVAAINNTTVATHTCADTANGGVAPFNTYTQIEAGQSSGLNAMIFACVLTSALVAGDTIRVQSSSGAYTTIAVTTAEFGGASITEDVASSTNVTNSPGTAPSASITPVTNGTLVLGGLKLTGPTTDTFTEDNDTTNGTWASFPVGGTSGGTATGNATARCGYKIITATGAQTYNPTLGTSRAYIISIAALQPAVSGTNWTQNPSDSVTVTDAVVNAPGPVKPDTGTLADAPATQTVTQLAPADTVTGTDVASNAPSTVPADTGTLADSDAEQVGRTQAVNDVLAGVFDPSTVTGLQGWWKADSLALGDGTAVSSWGDSSSGGHALVQASGTLQPLFKTAIQNGLPGLLFDGTNDLLDATGVVVSQPDTIFVVAKSLVTDANGHNMVDGITTRQVVYGNSTSPFKWDMYGGTELVSSTGADTSAHAISAVFNGASSELWLDGTQLLGGNAGTNQLNGLRVGSFNGGAAGSWNGYIFEILIYTGALSSADRQAVENYLGNKYALGFGSPGSAITDTMVKAPSTAQADTLTGADANVNAPSTAQADTITGADAQVKTPSTAQADTLTSADANVNSPAPVEADTGTLADSPTTQSVTQQFPADTITGTDATVNAPSHVEADTGTLADVDAEQSGKSTTASDSLTGTDANVNAPSTAQADTLTSADAQVKAPSTAQADTGTLADANVNAPNTGPADTITGTDANISAPSHAEADTGTLTDATVNAPAPAASDSLTGTDATAKAPSTAQADTGTFAEALVKDVALTKADLPTISDALVDDYRIILTDSATLGDSVTEQIFTFAPPPPIKLPTHPIIDPKRTFSLIVQTTTTATIDAKVTRCAIGAFKTTVGISPYHTTTAITRISSAAAIDRKGTSVTINA